MTRALKPRDAHTLMDAIMKEACGSSAFSVVDTSSFVSAGETVLSTGTENTLNALSTVIGRTLMAVRPYKAKLNIINAINTDMYTNRLRKVSFYSKDSQATGSLNTDLFAKNLYNGYDNGSNGGDSTASMWVQDKPVAVQVNFGGCSTWQECLTTYKYQIKNAFRSESDFNAFISGIMTAKANDIEMRKEAFNRMLLLNAIGATYQSTATECKVNLTEAFNTKFGTQYTSVQLRSTHLKEFMQFFVSRIKQDMRKLTLNSALYHMSPSKTVDGTTYNKILRHTPLDKQRLMLYNPLFMDVEAYVFPEIFNTKYLDIGKQYEGIDFWQSISTPEKVDVTPAITDSNGQCTKGTNVKLDYVVGLLYDVDALMVDYQLEDVSTTPEEARKHYRNTWWTFCRNAIYDPTENMILYYMADPSTSSTS